MNADALLSAGWRDVSYVSGEDEWIDAWRDPLTGLRMTLKSALRIEASRRVPVVIHEAEGCDAGA